MAEEQVIVITGASGGIGAALARAARGAGASSGARRAPGIPLQPWRDSGARCPAGGDRCPPTAGRAALRDRALAAFGHIDVWVNNAGRGITRSVLALSDEDIDEMISVNTKSALYGMQAIIPHFQQRGAGQLINVSSFLGGVPLAPFRAAYSAAKAALNTLTADLRMELARDYPQIHISLVMPGVVATEFAANALGGTPGWSPTAATVGGVQTPEEAAAAIVALIAHPVPEISPIPRRPPSPSATTRTSPPSKPPGHSSRHAHDKGRIERKFQLRRDD